MTTSIAEGTSQSSSRPSGGSTTRSPPATSTVGTIAETNGISASAASGTADDQQVLGLVPDRGDLAEHRAVGQPRGEADQLVVVVGVGVLDLREIGDRDEQQGVAQLVGGLAGAVDLAGRPRQLQQQVPAVPALVRDGERTRARPGR